MLKKLIQTLKSSNFIAECPHCSEELELKETEIFQDDEFSPLALEWYEQQLEFIREKKAELKELKEKGASKSEKGAKAVNVGFILERLTPTLPSFKFNRNDCRSLFDPIDYVIFEGLSQKGKVDKIFFVDVKTGNARLSKKQKAIKEAVESYQLKFKTYGQ